MTESIAQLKRRTGRACPAAAHGTFRGSTFEQCQASVAAGASLDGGSQKDAKKPAQEVTFSPFVQSGPSDPSTQLLCSGFRTGLSQTRSIFLSDVISMSSTLAPQFPAVLQCLVLISKYLLAVEKGDEVGKREGKQKCSSIRARLRGRTE